MSSYLIVYKKSIIELKIFTILIQNSFYFRKNLNLVQDYHLTVKKFTILVQNNFYFREDLNLVPNCHITVKTVNDFSTQQLLFYKAPEFSTRLLSQC